MNVEKFIRTLGYIVYVALWSPIIVLLLVFLPIMVVVFGKRMGMSLKECGKWYLVLMKNSIQHDMEFIRTGVWY